MKSAIVVFPGTNRDRDMAVALEHASGKPPAMVWHADTELPKVDLIVVPGGFAYGDYLRAGAMAAHSPIMREVVKAAGGGTAILGVCNGFQVLTEAGLLPGALMPNAGLKFVCRDVGVRVENSQTLFTCRYETGATLRFPVAHHDGNYFAGDDVLDRLEAEGRIAFRYAPLDDEADGAVNGKENRRINPNGSARDIAGIFNETKTVLGLMPHPENAIEAALGGEDGKGLFQGIAEALG
ncbi:MAG TPA: phosphoribosylformylglycinamidine synthase subunit PurQ [Alphaproteobacteria bacterium]|nr:phosphoribosylformylglycinamidine synthase subunit PurQ [Alphaproteobacteria bacterium]